MKTYVVMSRDRGDFVFVSTDKGKAEKAKNAQIEKEEFAGGRPSVYILETTLIT